MKWITLAVLFGAFTMVVDAQQDAASQETVAKPSIDGLAWMAGSWKSKRGKETSEEHWTGPGGNLMLGVHRDIKVGADGSKGFFEYLRIEQRGAAVYYYASPMGTPATQFKMTKLEKERVVFENPKHDFPQRILYWLADGKLHARAEATRDGKTSGQTWTWKSATLK